MAPKKQQKKAADPKAYDRTRFNCKEASDRYAVLSSKVGKVLPCYAVDPNAIETLGLHDVCALFEKQKCMPLLTVLKPCYEDEVRQFYANLYQVEGTENFVTGVNGCELQFSTDSINALLGFDMSEFQSDVVDLPRNVYFARGSGWPKQEDIPFIDRLELGEKYFSASKYDNPPASTYNLKKLPTYDDRMVYEFVHRSLVPTGGNLTEPTTCTALFFFFTREGIRFNPGYAITRHMLTVTAKTRPNNNMPYGNLITQLLENGLQDENPPFQFLSPPVAVHVFDDDFYKRNGMGVVDGKLGKRPPRVKSKRSTMPEPEVDEEAEGLASLYQEMKGTMSEMVALNKETYMLQKTYRAIQRAEYSSNFAFVQRDEGCSGSGPHGGGDNLDL